MNSSRFYSKIVKTRIRLSQLGNTLSDGYRGGGGYKYHPPENKNYRFVHSIFNVTKSTRFFVPVSNEKGVHQRLPGVSPSRSHVGQRATLPLSGGDSTESGTITVLFLRIVNLHLFWKN